MTIPETIDPKVEGLGEDSMVGKERWDEIQRLRAAGETVSAIARRLELDRKTVRSWLQKGTWTAYRREEPGDRLLDEHAAYLREDTRSGSLPALASSRAARTAMRRPRRTPRRRFASRRSNSRSCLE